MKKVGALNLRPTRLALLLLAAVTFTAAMLPAPGRAITCCTYSYPVTYYSDPQKTQYVGRCTYNEACTSDVICWGEQTQYYTIGYRSCCLRCGA